MTPMCSKKRVESTCKKNAKESIAISNLSGPKSFPNCPCLSPKLLAVDLVSQLQLTVSAALVVVVRLVAPTREE